MNFKEMQEIETNNIYMWHRSWTNQNDPFSILVHSFVMAFTPIGLHTLKGETIISTLGFDLGVSLIALPLSLFIGTVAILFNICTGNFSLALMNVWRMAVAVAFVALNLAITAMSIVTRPLTTLGYLLSIACNSLSQQNEKIEDTQDLSSMKMP